MTYWISYNSVFIHLFDSFPLFICYTHPPCFYQLLNIEADVAIAYLACQIYKIRGWVILIPSID